MKKLLKVIFVIILVAILIICAVFVYLNFIYLPRKVKSVGPAYLQELSHGRIQAKSIEYIPFKGVRLTDITLLSEAKEPITSLDKLYLNVQPWSLFARQGIIFDLQLYLPGIEKPFDLKGRLDWLQKRLALDLQLENRLLVKKETILAKATVWEDEKDKLNINLQASSAQVSIQGSLYIKGQDLYIERFSAKILDSTFEIIGELQNLKQPQLNMYADLNIDLPGLSRLNPEYLPLARTLPMDGSLKGEVYLSSQIQNPEIGLKMQAEQIKIDKIKIDSLAVIAKMQNKKVSLEKSYARLYEGEVNLLGSCNLGNTNLPSELSLNVFNIDMYKLVSDILQKESRVHGRLFSLLEVSGYLQDLNSLKGELWINVAGSNILKLPALSGITDVLGMPDLGKTEFNEAGGNFLIANQALRTDDFKIKGNNALIRYKGYIDFSGNLSFDVQPSFSSSLLATPKLGSILGVFYDSAGNFLGEIKLKGTLKDARHTFKPFAKDKLLPLGIEGLKELFPFKQKEE